MRSLAALIIAICGFASDCRADTFFSYENDAYTVGISPHYTSNFDSANFPPPPVFQGLTDIRNVTFTASNSLGQFVGTFDQGNCACVGTSMAFFYDGSTYSLLEFGSYWTIPTAINDAGQIVGIYDPSTSNGFNGFFFQSGQFTSLGPDRLPSFINNTGNYAGTGGSTGGFFYENGAFINLNPPGRDQNGYVRVTGLDDTDTVYGYFVNPIPEPSTSAMLLIGFAGVGFIAVSRRRKQHNLGDCRQIRSVT